MTQLPDLSRLSHDEKDALIRALWAQVQALTARVAALEARLEAPPKTPDNASLPPSAGQKAKRGETPKRRGPRQGSLGRQGGGRDLVEYPDETVIARLVCCAHCQAALDEADQKLAARYDKVDLPPVRPVVTRVERYTGQCRCCGHTTLAPVPEGLEPGTPFSRNIVALAIYLRVMHAISYRRLARLMLELFALSISEGALDAAFQRAMPDRDLAMPSPWLSRGRELSSSDSGILSRLPEVLRHARPEPLVSGSTHTQIELSDVQLDGSSTPFASACASARRQPLPVPSGGGCPDCRRRACCRRRQACARGAQHGLSLDRALSCRTSAMFAG